MPIQFSVGWFCSANRSNVLRSNVLVLSNICIRLHLYRTMETCALVRVSTRAYDYVAIIAVSKATEFIDSNSYDGNHISYTLHRIEPPTPNCECFVCLCVCFASVVGRDEFWMMLLIRRQLYEHKHEHTNKKPHEHHTCAQQTVVEVTQFVGRTKECSDEPFLRHPLRLLPDDRQFIHIAVNASSVACTLYNICCTVPIIDMWIIILGVPNARTTSTCCWKCYSSPEYRCWCYC